MVIIQVLSKTLLIISGIVMMINTEAKFSNNKFKKIMLTYFSIFERTSITNISMKFFLQSMKFSLGNRLKQNSDKALSSGKNLLTKFKCHKQTRLLVTTTTM